VPIEVERLVVQSLFPSSSWRRVMAPTMLSGQRTGYGGLWRSQKIVRVLRNLQRTLFESVTETVGQCMFGRAEYDSIFLTISQK
jgi:hypothetical protein